MPKPQREDERSKPHVPYEFVEAIKDAMLNKEITASHLAKEAGVSQAYMSRLLARKRGLPSDEILRRIARTLGIQPEDALLDLADRIPRAMRVLWKGIEDEDPLFLRELMTMKDAQIKAMARRLGSMARKRRK